MHIALVTGGLGFIGFNAVQQWSKLRPNCMFVIADSVTYAAEYKLYKKMHVIKSLRNVIFERADIRDIDTLEYLSKKHCIDTIVNFAAESHVDNSISGPMIFFDTNMMGTANLLEIARRHHCRYHQIGTDEVYGPSWPEDNITEASILKPSSPYSSSKASADLMTLSYAATFKLNATVSRCTNNIGPFQHSEKLVPTIIRKALNNEKIPIYGNGQQKRHWIDVEDHNLAILDILSNGKAGTIYNIAPNHDNWKTNLEIVNAILNLLQKPKSLIEHVADRAAHDNSYYLSPHNIKDIQSSHSQKSFEETLETTVKWYVDNQ